MVFLYDLTMPEILRRILAALLYAGLQGFVLVALLALAGDHLARRRGEMTPNPFRHLRLSGVFLTIAFRASWIAPPAFAPAVPGTGLWPRLRPLLAVLASFALLLALIPALDLARPWLHQILSRSGGYAVLSSIDTLQAVLAGSVVVGMLPLPGLLLGQTLPVLFPRLAKRWRKSTGIGLSLAAILLILGWLPGAGALLDVLRLV